MKATELQDVRPDSVLGAAIEPTLKQVVQQGPASQKRARMRIKMCLEVSKGLNGIVGFSELLSDAEDRCEHDEYVQSINEAAKRSAALMADVIEYVELDTKKVAGEPSDCSVKELLTAVEAIIRPWAQARGSDFTVIDLTGVASIRTDADHLCQCLLRMAESAVQLNEGGSVCMTVRREVRKRDSYLQFDVERSEWAKPVTGAARMGDVPPAGTGHAKEKCPPSDWGLAIAQRLAELLTGSLSVNGDAVFSLVIPVAKPVNAEAQGEAREHTQSGEEGILAAILKDAVATYRQIEESNGSILGE